MVLRRLSRFLAASVAAVLLLGCVSEAEHDPLAAAGPTTTPSDGATSDVEEAALPAGWTRATGEGVSIGVPHGWTAVPLEDSTISAEELRAALPDADETLMQQAEQVVRQGGVFMAYGPASAGITDNVNILSLPVQAPLAAIADQAAVGMRQVGAELSDDVPVELPAGEAVRVSYRIPIQTPSGRVTVEGVQYYVLAGDRTYVITFTARRRPGPVADAMARTFQVS